MRSRTKVPPGTSSNSWTWKKREKGPRIITSPNRCGGSRSTWRNPITIQMGPSTGCSIQVSEPGRIDPAWRRSRKPRTSRIRAARFAGSEWKAKTASLGAGTVVSKRKFTVGTAPAPPASGRGSPPPSRTTGSGCARRGGRPRPGGAGEGTGRGPGCSRALRAFAGPRRWRRPSGGSPARRGRLGPTLPGPGAGAAGDAGPSRPAGERRREPPSDRRGGAPGPGGRTSRTPRRRTRRGGRREEGRARRPADGRPRSVTPGQPTLGRPGARR